jgi:cob(I)alamin adenosyltransferase
MSWKIYTKTGDQGKTSLIGGTRVPKYDERIEAYGTVDELNAFTGLLRDQEIDDHSKTILLEIQNRLFDLESVLAHDRSKKVSGLPKIMEKDIEHLEQEIDKMNETLPPLTAFILPGGHPTISLCHVCRTVCRRAERLVLKAAENHPSDETGIKYLNRLSDYFFVLGRKFAKDLHIDETLWKARK